MSNPLALVRAGRAVRSAMNVSLGFLDCARLTLARVRSGFSMARLSCAGCFGFTDRKSQCQPHRAGFGPAPASWESDSYLVAT